MKIIQVTPGVIPIPPNGWGAVEKVIWEYKLSLEKSGYKTEILYTDEVTNQPGQIVHVHMANLAHLLHSRGIEYVFSLHDHHVEYFGKDSECYKTNYQAIKNSKLTFVHAKHLIDFFDNLPNIVYLPHGANLEDYSFTDRCERVRQRPHKLVMMANNGVGGNNLIDRKGFLVGINAAKKLDLEISIICPSKGNKEFFEYHRPNYSKLTIHYDIDHKAGLELLKESDIFLHPSNLEAGHPNLTLVEAVVSGLPVVGCLDKVDLPGMIKVNRDEDEMVSGITKAIDTYDSLVNACYNNRDFNSWDIIVTRMLNEYKVAFSFTEKQQLTYNYNSVEISHKEKLKNRGNVSNFKSYQAFIKNSFFTEGATNIFKDRKTGRILYWSPTSKKPASWSLFPLSGNQFIDIEVEVSQGLATIYKSGLELQGKRVLLEVIKFAENLIEVAEKFQEQTGCFLTIKTERFNQTKKLCFDSLAQADEFYFTLNSEQMFDFFVVKEKYSEKILFELNSGALGDTLGFVPYAQKWASINNKVVDVAINFVELFDKSDYPNLNFLNKKSNFDKSRYTKVAGFDYFYDRPLQKGFSDQLGLDFEELRTKVKKVSGERPIKSKYVCIGVQSTAQCKYWNYPDGWNILCKKLRKMGLTPVSLDMNEVFGIEGSWNKVPDSCQKKIGMSLEQIILHLQHCEFFIGVSSGLSWLSWAVGKKVVMISGTTSPDNEFQKDNFRVHRSDVCNSCFGKVLSYKFNPGDWLWCPEGKGTAKWFECTKTITPDTVIEKIEELITVSVTKQLL